ncbi:MAG: penicillin-binding protein [Streptococcaceae bacterium]|jgi:penicillin-binding protein 2X|nr:penicillin-binding protein [Streptococcaceae bacterium]
MMSKFLRRFNPFRRIKQHALADRGKPDENRRHIGRSIFFFSLFLFMMIVLRLTWIVATNHVDGINLAEAARANYTYSYTVEPVRGTIYDRTGVPIAVDSSTYTIYINLDKTSIDNNGKKLYAQPSEFPQLVDFLNKELNIPRDLANSQLNLKGAKQVLMGTNGTKISPDKKTQIENDAKKQGILGIGFTPDPARSYPNGMFASNLIGTAALKTPGDDTSGLVGVSGLEAAYNSILSGKAGSETVEKDMYGRAIPGAIISQVPARNGENIYTTLDYKLQSQLESLMNTAYQVSGGQQLSATLIDAHTGEILATDQRPDFNPQTGQGSNQKYFTWNSLLYQQAFEPGSTMKTFLVASSIDSGHWNGNQMFARKLNLYGTAINDWDVNEYNGYLLPTTVSAADGFAMSSNTVMSQVEMQMGNKTWDSYLTRLKFGVPTRFGMPSEAFGELPSSNLVTQVMSSFGQGISVTPIQMLRGWTSFANGGVMLEPHIVSSIADPNTGTSLVAKPEPIGKPFNASTMSQILSLMVTVGTNPTYGTANKAMFKNSGGVGPYYMTNGQADAVKTGTAQIASPTGGYMAGTNDTLNSVVAMYPPTNPDFIFYYTVKIPTGTDVQITANVVNPMLTMAEQQKQSIEASAQNVAAGKVKLISFYHQDPGSSATQLRQTLLWPVVLGDGAHVVDQSIASGNTVSANTRVLLLTDGSHTMPDMYGWSRSNVETLAKWYNVSVTYQGGGDKHDKGTVQSQSLDVGTVAKSGGHLTVTLSD